ncbi:preprotein translocase subunit SecE [Anaerohalosphaera lusitana]|uniref:Protein translocase subunit SecE n=1 Tax=Anaerohalosphaera lusitana TaxID=1936003 RepID=A0A1U9NPW5_9BACT|nr:preprotein translocase subunit SecE [Anaerohalosphaera lusitana]AQT69865.1 preprotein translocase subunit SecE [Anaerohalosphaera lusitana]
MGLKIYKSGQGYHTRLWTGISIFALVATGCYVLYGQLAQAGILVQTLVPMAICVAFAGGLFWLLNNRKVADFLISAEGEIKKVSWSSRREIVSSTMVVISVVIIMMILLFLADFVFRYVLDQVFNIY